MRGNNCVRRHVLALALVTICTAMEPARAADEDLAGYLADRGPGMPTSLFGTYVEKGQWLVYPFYEYTKSSAFEYKPSELGGV